MFHVLLLLQVLLFLLMLLGHVLKLLLLLLPNLLLSLLIRPPLLEVLLLLLLVLLQLLVFLILLLLQLLILLLVLLFEMRIRRVARTRRRGPVAICLWNDGRIRLVWSRLISVDRVGRIVGRTVGVERRRSVPSFTLLEVANLRRSRLSRRRDPHRGSSDMIRRLL